MKIWDLRLKISVVKLIFVGRIGVGRSRGGGLLGISLWSAGEDALPVNVEKWYKHPFLIGQEEWEEPAGLLGLCLHCLCPHSAIEWPLIFASLVNLLYILMLKKVSVYWLPLWILQITLRSNWNQKINGKEDSTETLKFLVQNHAADLKANTKFQVKYLSSNASYSQEQDTQYRWVLVPDFISTKIPP